METNLVNYQNVLVEQFESLEKILQKYIQVPQIAQSLATIKAVYQTKLKSLEPQIMVYGIYNAGKSSIINALLRSNKAKVADRPTTDSVDYFTWNGYKLADTPGVGAPIEHERVTQEHLKKADVVLFVMSTAGSFEYGQNYSRMKDIIDSGKKVLIVLNDKQGYLGDKDIQVQKDLSAIQSKIVKNMAQIGIDSNINNIENRYKIIVVNAEDAKCALEDNDTELWESSNIPELEKYINIELKNANSFVVLKNGINAVEFELNRVVSTLKDMENSEELKELNDTLTVLREQRTNLRKEMQTHIEAKTSRLAKNLPSIIWSQRENESAINGLVETEVNKVIESVQGKLESEITNINDVLASETEFLLEKLEKIRVNINTKIKVDNTESTAATPVIGENVTQVDRQEQLQNLYEAVKLMDQIYKGKKPKINLPIVYGDSSLGRNLQDVAQIVGTGQTLMKTFAPEVMKSMTKMLPSIIGKGAASTVGKFIPYIGPIITVVSILSTFLGDDANDRNREEMRQQNEAQQRRLEAEQQARQSLQQNCDMIAEDLKESLLINVNETIKKSLSAFEKILTEQISTSKGSSKSVTEDLNVICSVQNELNRIRVNAAL